MLIIIFPSVVFAGEEGELYKKWENKSSSALMNMGYDYYKTNSLDSASVCFSIVADRKYSKESSIEEISLSTDALIDLGYIYGYYYNDYQTALEKFQEAYSLAKENLLSSALPHIFLNTGGTYLECMKIYGGTIFADEVWENSELAFNYAVNEKVYEVALAAYLNVLTLPFEDNNWNQLKDWFRKFNNTKFPKGTDLYEFTKAVSNAMQEFSEKNYNRTLEFLELANKYAQTESQHQELTFYTDEIKAKVFKAMGRNDDMLKTLNNIIARAEELNRSDELTKGYHELYKYYSEKGDRIKADEYLLKYYKQKDTFFNDTKLSALSKMNLLLKLRQANEQARIEQIKRTNSERLSIILLVAALFAIGGIIYMISARRKQQALIRSLYKKNLELLNQEDENQQLRKKFSREIKDSDFEIKVAEEIYEDSKSGDNSENLIEENLDKDLTENKYEKSSLSEELKESLKARILECMDSTDLICNADFSLQKLSDSVKTSTRNCSQVINERMGKNFKTLLNEYRIREACRRLNDVENYGNYTIEAISQSVGFNSRSNFAVTFKKITGISPSEFCSAQRSNQK